MTDVFKITFGHYRRLIANARKGNDQSAIKVLSDLRDAVENSDMEQDAINALDDLLVRALENREARKRLIPVFPAKTQHKRDRNQEIIKLVSVAKLMGCSLTVEGDAFEWAANYYNKRHDDNQSSRNVRELWNGRKEDASSVGLEFAVTEEMAAVVGKYIGAQGVFCPVYFGPDPVDLDQYIMDFPELEQAANQALNGIEVKGRHRKAFAKSWLISFSWHQEIEPKKPQNETENVA